MDIEKEVLQLKKDIAVLKEAVTILTQIKEDNENADRELATTLREMAGRDRS